MEEENDYNNNNNNNASNSDNSNKKQKREDDPNHVHFKIISQKGEECYFRVKRTTKMGKVMDSYCQRKNLQSNTARFFYEQNRLTRKLILADLNMENGDEIHVFEQVDGGGNSYAGYPFLSSAV